MWCRSANRRDLCAEREATAWIVWSVLAKTVAAKSSAIWPGARIPQLSVGPPRNGVTRLGGNHVIVIGDTPLFVGRKVLGLTHRKSRRWPASSLPSTRAGPASLPTLPATHLDARRSAHVHRSHKQCRRRGVEVVAPLVMMTA